MNGHCSDDSPCTTCRGFIDSAGGDAAKHPEHLYPGEVATVRGVRYICTSADHGSKPKVWTLVREAGQ